MRKSVERGSCEPNAEINSFQLDDEDGFLAAKLKKHIRTNRNPIK